MHSQPPLESFERLVVNAPAGFDVSLANVYAFEFTALEKSANFVHVNL